MNDRTRYRLTIPGAEERLCARCESAAQAQYGDVLPQPVSERLEKELEKICENGFATNYLIAMQLSDISRKKGYAVTSRGLQYDAKQCPDCGAKMHGDGADILSEVGTGFWFDREPNVTINFAPKVRPMIIESLKESFGEDRVFRAGVYRELEDGSVRDGVHPGGVYILPEGVNIEEMLEEET